MGIAKLHWTDHTGQRHETMCGPEQPVVTVGRMADCQIRVVDTSVSRHHSTINYSRVGNEDVFEVIDLDSSNGTFVNEQEVKRQRLRPNDAVKCGNFQIHFEMIEMAAPAPMPGPPSAAAPTRFGPGAAGPGAGSPGPPPSPGGSPSVPYVDDPSIAMSPEHLATYGGGPAGYGGPPPPSPAPAPSPGYGAPPPYESRGPEVPSHMSPDQLRSELERALRRNDAMARDLDEMRGGQYGATYEQMRRNESDARRLREEVEQLREENEELRKEEQRIQAQMDALSDRNVDVKEQFSALQSSQGELRDRLREAREDLDNALFKRDELQADVERLEKDKVDLFDQLTKLKIEYNHLERAHEQVQKEHGLLEFEYKRLDETNQELERELRASLEGDNEQVDALNKLQAIADEKENLVRELRERVDELQEELKDTGDDSWMVEIETLKRDNEELRLDNDEMETKLVELQEQNSALKAQAESVSEVQVEEAQQLREENERLKKRLKDTVSQGAYNVLQEENEELRREVRNTKDELQQAQSGGGGTEELLAQIRQLSEQNRTLQAELEEQAQVTSTGPGDMKAIRPVQAEKVLTAFESMNGMVSGWRANLEAVQIQVSDLSELFKRITDALDAPLADEDREKLIDEVDEVDPEWACETMTDTVQQILADSKQIKSMLLDVRDQIPD